MDTTKSLPFRIAISASALLTIAVCGVVLAKLQPPTGDPAGSPAAPGGHATPHPALKRALQRLRCNPEELAASGIDAADAASLFLRVNRALQIHGAALAATDEQCATLNAQVDVLLDKLQRGVATPAEIVTANQLRAQLDKAQDARETILDNLFQAAVEQLASDRAERLRALRTNASWEVPVHFRVIQRSEADWVALRGALASERIAASYKQPIPAGAQALLGQALLDPQVAQAQASLAANLPAVVASWNQSLLPLPQTDTQP